jgi:hypothetical protein
MKRLRVYADTSVFGGCFDPEFEAASTAFFREVAAGRFKLLVGEMTGRELGGAPENVRKVLREIAPEKLEAVAPCEEIARLRDAYIAAGVLGAGSLADAEHVAAASVAEADILVSWNFKHIVHFDKIAGFQAVNLVHGYKPLRIYSPREVVEA